MSSYKNFQTDRNKNKNSVDTSRIGTNRRTKKDKTERLMEGVGVWTSFYRANPHRWVKDFLGVDLKFFQQILLYAMMHFNFLAYIAARGQGKNTK